MLYLGIDPHARQLTASPRTDSGANHLGFIARSYKNNWPRGGGPEHARPRSPAENTRDGIVPRPGDGGGSPRATPRRPAFVTRQDRSSSSFKRSTAPIVCPRWSDINEMCSGGVRLRALDCQ